MIYNENGVIINEDYYILEYLNRETELDILLSEGFIGKTITEIIRKMLDGISSFIDWIQRIPYSKQINIIKKNKDKIIKNINKKIEVSSGIYKGIDNFTKVCKNTDSNTTIEELKKTLYGEFTDKDQVEISADKVVNIAISVKDYISPLRKAYSEVKILNASLSKGEKIKTEVINELHSYLINAIKSIKNTSTTCIKTCIEALKQVDNSVNLYNQKKNEPVKYKSIKQIRKLKEEKHDILKNVYQGNDADDVYKKERTLGSMAISIFTDVAGTIMPALQEDGVSNIVWSNISLRLNKLSFIGIPTTFEIREKYKNNVNRVIQETYHTNYKKLDDWFDNLEKITVEEIEKELSKIN